MDIKKILNRDKKEIVNMEPLIESEIDEFRFSSLFIKTKILFYENQRSKEER